MPKALDFRIRGLNFNEAGKRIANATPPTPKKSGQKKSQNSRHRKK
jgi:hypothetical protein